MESKMVNQVGHEPDDVATRQRSPVENPENVEQPPKVPVDRQVRLVSVCQPSLPPHNFAAVVVGETNGGLHCQ